MPAFSLLPLAPPAQAPPASAAPLFSSSTLSLPVSSASSLPPPPPAASINHLLALRGNVTTKPTPGQSTSATLVTSTSSPSSGSSTSRPWLAGVIVAAVVVVILLALLAFWLTFRRRRRQRYEQARQHDPQLTPDQFRRRSHMSQADLAAEAERERRAIIRKSLVSRSSGSLSYMDGSPRVVSGPQTGGGEMEENVGYRGVPLGHQMRQPVPRPLLQPPQAHEREPQEHDRLQDSRYYAQGQDGMAAANLRDDWKEWESDIRRHKSRVAERHPSLAEVGEEGEVGEMEDNSQGETRRLRLVGDRPLSPPIPPRSRLRPLSTAELPAELPDNGTVAFLPRQVHPDPSTSHPDAASPTSLYSVDFRQPQSASGRRNSSGAFLG